jgi:hypothetical protein
MDFLDFIFYLFLSVWDFFLARMELLIEREKLWNKIKGLKNQVGITLDRVICANKKTLQKEGFL